MPSPFGASRDSIVRSILSAEYEPGRRGTDSGRRPEPCNMIGRSDHSWPGQVTYGDWCESARPGWAFALVRVTAKSEKSQGHRRFEPPKPDIIRVIYITLTCSNSATSLA